jgi:IclR family transcriptional regulator, pca regulon regulatory protein
LDKPEVEKPGALRRDLVLGLEKGLAVIGAFDQSRAWLTIAEVAARCDISRAAARRYLITLVNLGYIVQQGRRYALTAKVLRLGQSYFNSAQLPKIVQGGLIDLAAGLRQAASAGVLDGDDVISIAATTAGRQVSTTLQSGTRVPAYCTSNGRVLVGALKSADRRIWVERQKLVPRTPMTIISVKRLSDEIERTRENGYALVDQELEIGLRTVAVPLKNMHGEIIAAMNVSASADTTSLDELVDRYLPALLDVQARLRRLLF